MTKKPTNNYNIEEITKVYNEEKYSLSKTAERLGFKKGAMTRWLRRNYPVVMFLKDSVQS